MARTIIEKLREDAISDIFSNSTFQKCWEVWKPIVLEKATMSPMPSL